MNHITTDILSGLTPGQVFFIDSLKDKIDVQIEDIKKLGVEIEDLLFYKELSTSLVKTVESLDQKLLISEARRKYEIPV